MNNDRQALTPALGYGLLVVVPLLFALYGLFVELSTPASRHARPLAAVQLAFVSCGCAALAGVPALVRDGLRPVLANWRTSAALVGYTLLGPPLWLVAVIYLRATPANWLDLGLVPVGTIALGLMRGERPKGSALLAPFLAVGGILCVAASLASMGGSTTAAGIGIAAVSAAGTILAQPRIQTLAKAGVSRAGIMAVRFTIPAVLLLALWAALSTDMHWACRRSVAETFLATALLFALAHWLYNTLLKSMTLRFSGYMWGLVPVFTSILAGLVLPEDGTTWSLPILGGGILISVAAIIDERMSSTRRAQTDAPKTL